MIYLLIAGLVLGLLLLLRLVRRQNRALRELRASAKGRQPFLHEEPGARFLPEWRDLVATINDLIAENSLLQQQRTDQLTQLEATLGNLREAVLIVDEENYIHLANRAAREIFPASRELVNLRLELIFRSGPFLEYVRAIRAGEPLPRQEFELIDGTHTLWIEASGAPIASPGGRSRWALFVIHNLTNERKLERVRRDFVANASHELRTPLSVIKGYIETLVDHHETMSLEERTKFLQTIHRHSDRLKAIIDDLLVLSRLESATPGLQFAPIALAPFFESLADEFRHPPAGTPGREIVVSVTPDLASLEGDTEKLTQVFSNLLENALKYTPPGSRIELSASALGEEIECLVRDNGPGIPPEDLPHIFERFYRVEKGRSRETGGTGLGLSIVKHIVQLHGGRVWAENREGGGLAIFLRLPRVRKA